MKVTLQGKPAFAYVDVDLAPGESFIAESDAMASMSAELDMKAKFNGGFFSGIAKKVFGGESLFVNHFVNNTNETKRVTLSQPNPGDMKFMELNGDKICLQPGAYICSSPGINLGVKWAGIKSYIAREGLFKLVASGKGILVFGTYGGLVEKDINEEYIVDTSHLVGYEPHLKLKIKLAGGFFSSIFGGEGLVTKVVGNGKIYMQSRSLDGVVKWTNKHIR